MKMGGYGGGGRGTGLKPYQFSGNSSPPRLGHKNNEFRCDNIRCHSCMGGSGMDLQPYNKK